MADGLLTNCEMIDSIMVDMNNVLKEQQSGQFIQACCTVAQMTQKLLNLRKTIDDDLKSRERTIEDLKNMLRAAGCETVDVPVEKLQFNDVGKDGGN